MGYIRNIFTEYNCFTINAVNNIIYQEFSQVAQQGTVETKNQNIIQNMQLLFFYSGKQGHQLLSINEKAIKKNITRGYQNNDNL